MQHVPVHEELSERVRWLIRLRWYVLAGIAVCVGAATLLWRGVLPVVALWLTTVAIGGYNLVLQSATRDRPGRLLTYERLVLLMRLQVMADLVALTVLLHFSGGLENPFAGYYILLVSVGSIMMSRQESRIYALAASLLWLGLLLLEAWGVLHHYNLTGFRLPLRYREPLHIISEALVIATANLAVGHVSSSVAERLRSSERQLYEANAACELRAGQLYEANSSCELRAGELDRLNQRLQELDRDRAFFIRLVTHELRAPVAAIQSYLRLILDGYVPQERMAEIVGKAEQRARDQLELIGDLLDLAHIQQAKNECPVAPADVRHVLNDVLDLMRAHAESKAIAIRLEIPEALSSVPLTVEHIKQIWTNLVSNAIKYTPNGGQVTITLSEDDRMVHGAVRDTGIGIAPEDRERVFETFYRTEQAKAMSRQGTGLGLSIVRGIMQHYGGRVWVESEVGDGSTFRFELPKCPPASAPHGA